MMAAGLLFSILLPLLAGIPWLLAVQARRAPGGWALAIGYGYALGLLITVIGMRALYVSHVPVGLLTAMILPLAAAAAGWWRMREAPALARADALAALAAWRALSRMARIVCAAALALIALRMITLGAEILLRPLFPWEAVSAVATKARAWYELGAMAPFVTPAAWLEGLGNYTDIDPGALALPSLLLVWTAHAIGQWHEGAVGAPWWMLGLAVALALYGHLRRGGAGVPFALCVAWLFLSLPIVDLHIGLAGAPQWVGAAGVGLAGCALLRWLETGERELLYGIGIGALLAGLSMPTTWSWLVLFALAGAMRTWPRIAGKVAVGVPLLTVLAAAALSQTPVKIGGTTLQVQIAGNWGETLESLFLLDNWHLLYGIALLVAIVGGRRLLAADWQLRTWIIGMGLLLMFVSGVLAMPGVWYGGLRDFSFAALQFAPLLLLWTATAARASAYRFEPPAAAAA